MLKEFNPQVRDKIALDKAQAMFEREASILYQLNHPQIPRFRELLREGDKLFLVQDYIEGPSYHELLNRRRQYADRFSEAEVTQLLTQLLPVLQYLHSVGIVHRDISPDNLIQRNADGRPVLIDFGGVKQLVVNVRYQLGVPEPYQSPGGQVTRLGKVGYAPEEQMESGQVNPRYRPLRPGHDRSGVAHRQRTPTNSTTTAKTAGSGRKRSRFLPSWKMC